MPFTFKTPLVTSQGEFPYAALTLVVSPAFRDTTVEAQIILKAQPYNIVDGKVIRPTEICKSEQEDGSTVELEVPSSLYDRNIVFGEGYNDAKSNPALAKALLKISASLQEFLLVEDRLQEGED